MHIPSRTGATTGVADISPASHRKPPTTHRKKVNRMVAGGLAVITTTGALVTFAGLAQAGNPPTGPGNIEIFAKRDMVALEGYADQAGETATVTVSRNGQQVGIGEGVVDATGFLEFNHPGGSCWTGVTPNIRGGDLVEVKFSETAFTDGAVTSSVKIDSVTPSGNTVNISGTYGADVSLDRFVVEVINPEMRRPDPSTPATLIGERAIGWTPVPDAEHPNGGPGYTAEGTAANGEFSVNFTAESAADAERIADGDHVALTWMADAGELALGATQYEFEESDGPGFGGCPAGPTTQPPVAPSTVDAARSGGDVTLTWTTPSQPADANPVTHYRVAAKDTVLGQEIAIRQGANTTGPQTATIKGLDAEQAYPLIIEAYNGMWSPVSELGTLNADGTFTPYVDPNAPGDTPPVTGGGETPPPPPVEQPGAVAPTAPSVTRVIAGSQSITAEWTAAQPGNPTSPVTGYELTATPATGAPVTTTVTGLTGTVTGLTNGTAYTVSVVAKAGELSTPATIATGVTAAVTPGDVVTVSRAQYRADRNEYRISGTSTSTTVHVRIGTTLGSGATIQLSVPVLADGTWSIDRRNGPVLPADNRFNVVTTTAAPHTGITSAMTRVR